MSAHASESCKNTLYYRTPPPLQLRFIACEGLRGPARACEGLRGPANTRGRSEQAAHRSNADAPGRRAGERRQGTMLHLRRIAVHRMVVCNGSRQLRCVAVRRNKWRQVHEQARPPQAASPNAGRRRWLVELRGGSPPRCMRHVDAIAESCAACASDEIATSGVNTGADRSAAEADKSARQSTYGGGKQFVVDESDSQNPEAQQVHGR